MNSMPKIIGDFMELAFSSKICKVKVEATQMLSENIKMIRFKGHFPHVNFKIGQAVIIRVDDTNYRNYTPSKWNSKEGTFEVIFHIHKNGPGSQFVENLKINDQVTVGMPRGFEVLKKEEKYQFFYGDETCISVFKSLKDEIDYNDNNYLGILELDPVSMKVPDKLGFSVDIVPKSINKAEFAIDILNKLDSKIWDLWQHGYFYLMGNAKSIQAFRKVLKEKGVPNKKIYTQPYWAEGKIGL
ncbi:FAD-binding oxidoreductase [Flavobacterium aquidurense]|uniref:Oxidoreductase FAD-binding domain protein n=1 Tax=Flavobacterium aquidurense TaxID=362413 RepID=A0A0Q0SC76_9FLAO|nr:FAD-binding oxidoreductase [Flavobacterium aquidurense]KQB41707.1 Oxidoreductase FAD-binding domain protein [Flavobacterium aquidurense]